MGQLRTSGSFAAQGDDGRHYLVTRWVEFVDLEDGDAGGPRLAPTGFECWRLDDGRSVNVSGGGRYEIADDGILLDPIAGTPEPVPAPIASVPSQPGAIGNGADAGESSTAQLMVEFGVRRVGRFFVCHGYHYSSLDDAVAYARRVQAQPSLAQEEEHANPAPTEELHVERPGADDERVMDRLRITFANGQYIFDGYKYDHLRDAVAQARSKKLRSTAECALVRSAP